MTPAERALLLALSKAALTRILNVHAYRDLYRAIEDIEKENA